jgi:hypothetical protein
MAQFATLGHAAKFANLPNHRPALAGFGGPERYERVWSGTSAQINQADASSPRTSFALLMTSSDHSCRTAAAPFCQVQALVRAPSDARNSSIAVLTSSGASSIRKWPASIARPCTSSPHRRHTSNGMKKVPVRSRGLQSTSSGHVMRRPVRQLQGKVV